jgi:hypothetical protein
VSVAAKVDFESAANVILSMPERKVPPLSEPPPK